jgi:CO/xanthine dehydrogenase Mo-binding subunit
MPTTARLDRRDFLKRTAAGTSGLVIGFYLSPSVMSRFFPGSLKNGLDNSSVEDPAELKYSISNFYCDYVLTEAGIPVGFWRSVGNSQNGYIAGCFVDEIAKAGGKDPFEFRRKLLANAPRHRADLELAADKAASRRALPRHRGRRILWKLRRRSGGDQHRSQSPHGAGASRRRGGGLRPLCES